MTGHDKTESAVTIDRNDRSRSTGIPTNFKINWHGHLSIPHWARVRVNGLMLAKRTGANTHVVELFAFFHDSCRIHEYTDDGHGHRGALLASKLQGHFFEATEQEMTLLAMRAQRTATGCPGATLRFRPAGTQTDSTLDASESRLTLNTSAHSQRKIA